MLMMSVFVGSALAAGPCPDGGRLRLHCPVKGGKELAICEEKAGLVYRFGKAGTPELQLRGGTLSHRRTGADSERHLASFWNAGHRYAVAVDRTEDQFEARLVVRKGATQLTTVACREPVSVDFTETAGRFVEPASARTAWIGAWDRGGDARLTIAEKDGKLHVVEGLALFHMGPDNVHTGEVRGVLTDAGGGTRTVTQGDCTLTLEWMAPGQLRAGDNGRCGGLNVRFDGEFWREP
jgi:hypothetical protein